MLYCTFYYSTLDQEETPRDEPKKIGALSAYSFQYDAYVNRSIPHDFFFSSYHYVALLSDTDDAGSLRGEEELIR